jgi:DNA-binding response OmpR family regulator
MDMGQAKYILVGEDDKFYGKIYLTKFPKEGLDVKVVTDGQQVLDELKARRPDLLLLDMVMPVKDGFAVLSEIHKDPGLSDLKVIVLSSLGQEEDTKKAIELGANDYIVKTNVSIGEIVDKVKSFLVN